MNILSINTLKVLRKLYSKCFRANTLRKPECEQDPDKVSQILYEALMADKPCMVARFGANELSIVVNYLSITSGSKNIIKYINGEQSAWWWQDGLIKQMNEGAGFFPPTHEMLKQFSELMIKDIPEVDILGSWLPYEKLFEKELSHCLKVNLELLNPYFSKKPWTSALEKKKVLVVHPFAQTIESQYKKRELLFENNLLPEFELITIKAVQSYANETVLFADWFAALEYMKDEIDKVDYDICLIGCGAYGFPLAAHVKSMGKKGFHIGGSLQLLFGIRGKRWENENYNDVYNYSKLMNEYWVKPAEQEKPRNASKVEGACYW